MSKHTPGPWNLELEGSTRRVIRGDYASGKPRTVCIVESWTTESDAQLIAAAPELLEALNDCITDEGATCFMRSESHPEYMRWRLEAINELARSIIAKATAK